MSDARLELEAFLPYRLMRLADTVSRAFAETYRHRHGLTRPEWRVFATLGEFGTMTATAVGRHSAMHKTKVSRAVAALEKRRWVERSLDEGDRRIEHLTLTKAGLAAYRDMVPVARGFEDELLSRLGKDERQRLLDGLSAIEAALIGDPRAVARQPDMATSSAVAAPQKPEPRRSR